MTQYVMLSLSEKGGDNYVFISARMLDVYRYFSWS